MSITKAIARAWTDPAFKEKLLKDPKSALADHGIEVPAGSTVRVVEDSADVRHVVLPAPPANPGQIDVEELERIAAGWPTTGETCAPGSC